MAKRKQPETKRGGPYLAAAFFCETTIEDKEDGALSAIRMVDQITFVLEPSAPLDFPSETQRLPVHIRGVLSFKTGDSPGEHRVRVAMESPSGKMDPSIEQVLPFPPQPHGGANLRLNTTIMVKKGGLFWFHVFLDEKEVTRIPLQISVQRAELTNQTPSTDPSVGGEKPPSAK